MQRHITEFLGPIFAKEVVEIARRLRYYLVRTVYAIILLCVMVIAWEEFQFLATRVGVNNSLARFAGIVFTATSYIQYWSAYLLVPAFLCGVVAGEREEHTLDLLFITPLTDREIVLGKLFSRVAAAICVILCGVPVLSLIMLFGGVGPESIWRMFAATLLAIFFAGSHAIYFSVIGRGPMEALMRTYVALFFWLAGLPVLSWAWREVYRALPALIQTEFIDVVSPYFGPAFLAYPLVSFWGAVDQNYHATLVFIWGGATWPVSFVVPGLWSILLCWRAVKRLRQTPKPRVDLLRWLPGVAWFRRRAARPAAVTKHRARAARIRFFGAVQNPLWLRARLTRVYDRAGAIVRMQWLAWSIVLITLALLLILGATDIAHDEGYAIAFQMPTWLAIQLVTALVAGHSLIGDRRRGFLDLVAVTPLTGREVIDGTMLALWEHLGRLLWLPWLLGIFFCVIGATTPVGALFSLITATSFCVLLVYQGVACSLAAQTTPGAVVSTFILPLTVIFVMPMGAMSFRENHGPALWTIIGIWFVVSSIWVWSKLNAASAGSFLMALHLLLIALAECWTHNQPSDHEFPMAAMHPYVLMVLALVNHERERVHNLWALYWVAIILCYWAAIAVNIVLIRYWLIRHFDRLVGRTDVASKSSLRVPGSLGLAASRR